MSTFFQPLKESAHHLLGPRFSFPAISLLREFEDNFPIRLRGFLSDSEKVPLKFFAATNPTDLKDVFVQTPP